MEQGQDQLPGTPRYIETKVTRHTICKNEVHGTPPPLAVNKKLTVTPLHCEPGSVATLSRCKARYVNLTLRLTKITMACHPATIVQYRTYTKIYTCQAATP